MNTPFPLATSLLLFFATLASGAEVNVRDFGARGDCRRASDGAMAVGSQVLSSAAAHFRASDAGLPIYVLGASKSQVPGLGEVAGAPLSSRIEEVMDEHTIRLKDAASQEVRGGSVTWGTDDSAAIQRAIDSLSETGGTVFFPPGLYRVTYQGGPGLHVAASNIRLYGVGEGSGIFNSTVLFRAKVKDGATIVEQSGVPALYAGTPAKAIANVEVDHLWLGDNGRQYEYKKWGPHGWGVLGAAGKIDHFHFHDITIETAFLCGINMDSQTDGFEIDHVTVRSSGEHGFYLAGTGAHGEVHDNRVIGLNPPMRQGIVLKKKEHVRVAHNEIRAVEFQALVVAGDDPSYLSKDITIEDNDIGELSSWHTDAIDIFNADGVVIRGNRISNVAWTAIYLHTWNYRVTHVVVEGNVLSHIASPDPRDPAFAISCRCDPPRGLAAGAPWPGTVADIVLENNTILDSPRGIAVKDVGGRVQLRGNRIENSKLEEGSIGFSLAPLAGAEMRFTENMGLNFAENRVPSSAGDDGNILK